MPTHVCAANVLKNTFILNNGQFRVSFSPDQTVSALGFGKEHLISTHTKKLMLEIDYTILF